MAVATDLLLPAAAAAAAEAEASRRDLKVVLVLRAALTVAALRAPRRLHPHQHASNSANATTEASFLFKFMLLL